MTRDPTARQDAKAEEALGRMWDEAPEPAWFKQATQRAWQIGDRVRVRLSRECPVHYGHGDHDSRMADGRSGRIYRMNDSEFPHHPILVEFDEPIRCCDGGPGLGIVVAPTEIDPLDDDARGAGLGE